MSHQAETVTSSPANGNINKAALPDGALLVAGKGWYEVECLVNLAGPILISVLCAAILPLTSLIYAARLEDSTTVAGISLGISVCNVSGMCIYYGMATGIDTLASQAFGAKNSRLVGVVFARGTLLTALIFFVPVTILWYYMGTVVLMLGQDPAVAEVTGTFTRAYVWGMVPYVVFENAKRCLQAQNIAVPEMIVGILGVVANIGFHQLTMGTLGWGAYGAGLALSTTWFFMLGIFVVAIAIFKLGGGDWWSGICSCDVFLGWPEYLRLCIPGLVGVFIEWTAWEASAFISGMAGKEDLATQGILLSTYGLVFSAALAISIGANISVGNRLGEHNPDSARESAWGAISVAFWTALLVAGGLGLGARLWPRLFGVSESGISKIVELAPLYAVVQFLDIVQMTCTGILKGMGRQRVQAQATFVAFYLGAVPLMAYLVFNLKWGVRGLWTGIGIAELPLLAFYLYVIYNANWKELAEATHRRLSTHLVGASSSVSSGSGDSYTDEEGWGGGEMDDVSLGGRYGSGGGMAAGGYDQEIRVQTTYGGGVTLHEKARLVVQVSVGLLTADAPVSPLNC